MVRDDNFFCKMISNNTQLIIDCVVVNYLPWADNHAKLSSSSKWEQQKNEIKKEYSNYLEYHNYYCSETRHDTTIPIDRFIATGKYFDLIKKIDDLTGYTNWRISPAFKYSKIQTDFLEELEIDKVMRYTRRVFGKLIDDAKALAKQGGNWNSTKEQDEFITELTTINDTLIRMTRVCVDHSDEYNSESFIAFVPNRIKEINKVLTKKGCSLLSIPSFFLVGIKEPRRSPIQSCLPHIMYASPMFSSNFIISRSDDIPFQQDWEKYGVEITNLANSLIYELKNTTDSREITNLTFLKENKKKFRNFTNKVSQFVSGRAPFSPQLLDRNDCIDYLLTYIHTIDAAYVPGYWRGNFDYNDMLKKLQEGIGIRCSYIMAFNSFIRIVQTFDTKCISEDNEFIKKRDIFKNTIIKNTRDSLMDNDPNQDYPPEAGANYLTSISILYDEINDFYENNGITVDAIPLDPIFQLIDYEDESDSDDDESDSDDEIKEDNDMEMDKD